MVSRFFMPSLDSDKGQANCTARPLCEVILFDGVFFSPIARHDHIFAVISDDFHFQRFIGFFHGLIPPSGKTLSVARLRVCGLIIDVQRAEVLTRFVALVESDPIFGFILILNRVFFKTLTTIMFTIHPSTEDIKFMLPKGKSG